MDSRIYQRNRAIILALAGITGLILLFALSGGRKKWILNSGVVWSTEYHIKYFGTEDLSDSISAVLRKVELSVSPFNKASRITAVNNNETDRLDEYLVRLYNKSCEINAESGGAFDPTVSPVINAWGFGYENGMQPTKAVIDSLLDFVGIRKTKLNGNRLIKSDSRISFNFSAIAKGMGSDEVGAMLRRNGITDYMVEIGGEIVVAGKNPQGEKWRISVDKPIESVDSVVHSSADVISVSGCAIATSGNYRNFKIDKNGRRYAHTIDPSTGYPRQSDVLSATVIAGDCMTADAYATTLMVLGMERSKRLLASHPELSAMLITADSDGSGFRVWRSGNFPE